MKVNFDVKSALVILSKAAKVLSILVTAGESLMKL
jgi:hypothetical protein